MEAGLAARMREFRGKVRAIAPAGQKAIARMLMRQYRVAEEVAVPAAAYLHAQHRYADIPVEGELLVERVPDEGAGELGGAATVLVFHTMIGRAANEALARVVAYRMHQRFGGRLGGGMRDGMTAVGGATVVVDDYAFGVWVEATTAARRADRTLVRSLLSPAGFEEDLVAAVETSDLFRRSFGLRRFGRMRFCRTSSAGGGLLGRCRVMRRGCMRRCKESEPDHFLIGETRRTVMEDVLCAPAARGFLEKLPAQGLRLLDLPAPSPFAFGLFATGRRDTLQLADTADFLLAMYEQVQRRIAAERESGQAELFS